MLDAISRKVQHMWLLNSEHDHHKDMMSKVKGAATPEEAKQYLEELDRFFEEEEKLLAFSSHDAATQAKFQLASSYSDEWVSSRKCHFRMWYVCRGRTRWCEVDNKPIECLFVILSKSWDTLFEDPLAPGQRWKCTCGTRYRAGFGVICEVKVNGVPDCVYLKAEVPDKHVEDARAIFYEEHYNPPSPEALYQMVPVCAPMEGGLIRPVDPDNGIYQLSHEDDARMPWFDWYQIFTFCGTTLPEKVKKNKKNRK